MHIVSMLFYIAVELLCSLYKYSLTVPIFNSCTKCAGRSGMVHDYCLDSWVLVRSLATNIAAELSLDMQLHGSLICLTCFYFDVLSMDVCTKRCCWACGRLVQELAVFTVVTFSLSRDIIECTNSSFLISIKRSTCTQPR